MVLALAYFYSKSAAVVLAVTFATHLLLRAQWIALVGMHSVYPDGVRLDRLKMGPLQREIEQAQPGSTAHAIERADNRASVVFAIGVSVALIIGTMCIAFCGVLLLATPVARALGLDLDPATLFAAACAIFMLPFLLASSLDQMLGKRLRRGSLACRATEATLRFYTRLGMGRRNNHIIAILASNGGERKMMALVIGVMLVAILGVCVAYVFMRGNQRLGSYAQFPHSDAMAIDPAHYDNRRDPARDPAVPYVQSEVVAGPYLEVVVPYRPERDDQAMHASCARRSAGLEDEALAAARLACLSALHPVSMDGKPLPDLRYEIASDPRTDRPALLAMIDVRDLPRGRHELRVAHPPRSDRGPDKDDPGHDLIPFWR
jgi:hypothetical protein